MFWLMIAVAVGGGIALPISVVWSKHRQKLAELEAANDAGDVELLRARIHVLERIATDSNTVGAIETRQIAQEIEALRDRQS